ncbi:xanthine dehydrogenase family protein molybdopterin-binding subunit [Cohnella caldifontis]|uniref:xanthine dehydrogenase family protein molybdopterin-binding subunit n=1 Tax=Cohnella caldifontis TaxID=3027471 RepID=UPI003BB702CF
MHAVGQSVYRKDGWDKVTGTAVYTDDMRMAGMLHAALRISPYAHARIKTVDWEEAGNMTGVRAVLLGESAPLIGEEIRDRPPIAYGKVRYHGEPVAVVVADTPMLARDAADRIRVEYEPLPVLGSPSAVIQPGAPLVHERLGQYEVSPKIYPVANTNIANRTKIRKGDAEKAFTECEVTAENEISFSPSHHAAIETKCCIVKIAADGTVFIITSSQAPYMVKKLLSSAFGIEVGKIEVHTPLVGGAYGGKATIQWEILAYLASRAVGGKPVKLYYTREEDILTAPCHVGLDARVKLGCTADGKLLAAEMVYLFDGGAYADKSPDLSRAGGVDCTGPYRIENVSCDSYSVYTNHPYPGPFRGFAHSEVLFAFERTMDLLAHKLGMDPLELRRINAIVPGDRTPTQVLLNPSNVGNLPRCLERLEALMNWREGRLTRLSARKVRAKGISGIWKNSTIDPFASSGVLLLFNPDGSLNLLSGVVEIGTGTKTALAQMVAEKLKMDVGRIHVKMEVDTRTIPEHWKTVASRGTFMAGRAALAAADDLIRQLKDIASCVLRCVPDDLEVGGERVYLRDDPRTGLPFPQIVYGYTYPNGNAIGGQIVGRGHYILRHLTYLDPETGAGRTGPEWTVGAQGVEVEYDERDHTYVITKAVSVIDIGRVLNPKAAKGQVMGAMSMGLSFAGRETFEFTPGGIVQNPQFRTYRPLRFGEHPEYIVDFVETPQLDAPFGARGIGEHGLIGMPAALANALSLASGTNLNRLPLVPETIWRRKRASHDSL